MADGAPIFDPSNSEDALARRYARLVRRCARPYFLTGGDYDDLTQEGMIGLLKAGNMTPADPTILRHLPCCAFAARFMTRCAAAKGKTGIYRSNL